MPLVRQYSGGYMTVNPYAEAYLDEVMEWRPEGVGEEAAREVMYDLLSALAACHAASLAHNNIRPEVCVVLRACLWPPVHPGAG